MRKCIIAVDPGATSGAIAILDIESGRYETFPMPIAKNSSVDPNLGDLVDSAKLRWIVSGALCNYNSEDILVVIERVHSMPKQGLVSTFKFGLGCGIIASMFDGFDVVYVEPARWTAWTQTQTDFFMKEKSCRRDIAFELTGVKAKNHNIADALLIAHYARNVLCAKPIKELELT